MEDDRGRFGELRSVDIIRWWSEDDQMMVVWWSVASQHWKNKILKNIFILSESIWPVCFPFMTGFEVLPDNSDDLPECPTTTGHNLTRHICGKLLDRNRFPWIEKVVHIPQRLFTWRASICLGTLPRTFDGVLILVVGGGLYFINIHVDGGLPRLHGAFLVLVQDTDASILPDPVGNFQWIDPHGKFWRKGLVEKGRWETAAISGLGYDRVHFSVYPDTPIAGAFEWFLWEPVVSVPPPQNLNQAVSEFGKLTLTNISTTESDEVYEEVWGGEQFQFHTVSLWIADWRVITVVNPLGRIGSRVKCNKEWGVGPRTPNMDFGAEKREGGFWMK